MLDAASGIAIDVAEVKSCGQNARIRSCEVRKPTFCVGTGPENPQLEVKVSMYTLAIVSLEFRAIT